MAGRENAAPSLVDVLTSEQSSGRMRGDGTSTGDEIASFKEKHGRKRHGCTGGVATDQSGIGVKYAFWTAKDHDSRYIDELVKDEPAGGVVIADSAYSSVKRRWRLRARGVIDEIAYKRVRGQAELPEWQALWNTLVSRLHAKVEHPLGMIKQQFCCRRVRYRGLERNAFDFLYDADRSEHETESVVGGTLTDRRSASGREPQMNVKRRFRTQQSRPTMDRYASRLLAIKASAKESNT